MNKKNFLETQNMNLKISIEEVGSSKYSVLELRIEAILALINDIELKDFDGDDMIEKYEGCIKRIQKALKDNKERK